MPHATSNGETSSQFISHLTSLPAVNEGIETFKTNSLGKKSLEIADGVYHRFGKPVEPYLETPYSYAKPYVQKADELADSGLSHVETHFPIVTKDTSTIIDTTKSYVLWPYHYVSSTYSDEYSKTAKHNDRGKGVYTGVLALISTELKIASDFFQTVADFLGPKYEESKKKGSEYLKDAEDTANSYLKAGQDKLGEAQKKGEKAYDSAKGDAQKTYDSAKGEAQKAGDQVKDTANKAGDQAKDTANKAKDEASKTKDEAQKKASK